MQPTATVSLFFALSLTVGCTTTHGADGTSPLVESADETGVDASVEEASLDSGSVSPAMDSASDTSIALDTYTPPMDDGDDHGPPGSCGTSEVAVPLPPLATPTCTPSTRGFRKLAGPGDVGKSLDLEYGAVWSGREVFLAGAATYADYAPGAVAYDPATDKWRDLPAPKRLHCKHVFAGGLWYALGSCWRTDDTAHPMSVETYDPLTNSWTQLPDAPIVERLRPAMVWSTTTNELIVWGGTRTGIKGITDVDLADGAAWNPATKTWRTLAPSPLRARWMAASVWDGHHLVIAYGALSAAGEGTEAMYPMSRAAMYDPAKDAWTMLCDPPASKRIAIRGAELGPTGELGAFWGGSPGYGGDGDGPPPMQDGVLFDAQTLSWRMMATPPPGEWTGTAKWVANGKLWAWGAPIGTPGGGIGGVVYDPVANTWSTIDDVWGPAAYDAVAVWTGCDLLLGVGATGPTTWALFRP